MNDLIIKDLDEVFFASLTFSPFTDLFSHSFLSGGNCTTKTSQSVLEWLFAYGHSVAANTQNQLVADGVDQRSLLLVVDVVMLSDG